jgi:hypothetical protein
LANFEAQPASNDPMSPDDFTSGVVTVTIDGLGSTLPAQPSGH